MARADGAALELCPRRELPGRWPHRGAFPAALLPAKPPRRQPRRVPAHARACCAAAARFAERASSGPPQTTPSHISQPASLRARVVPACRPQLYENVIKDIEDRIKPESLVQLAQRTIDEVAEVTDSIKFLEPIVDKVRRARALWPVTHPPARAGPAAPSPPRPPRPPLPAVRELNRRCWACSRSPRRSNTRRWRPSA